MARAAKRPAYPNLSAEEKAARAGDQAATRKRERRAASIAAAVVAELNARHHAKLGAAETATIARFILRG